MNQLQYAITTLEATVDTLEGQFEVAVCEQLRIGANLSQAQKGLNLLRAAVEGVEDDTPDFLTPGNTMFGKQEVIIHGEQEGLFEPEQLDLFSPEELDDYARSANLLY